MKPPAPDVTPVLEAIEAARIRMIPLKGVDLACAAVTEMQNIIRAKNAYDERVALLAQVETTDRVLDLIFGQQPPRGSA